MMWAYYLLANHLDQVEEYDDALKLIDLAIDHTPTIVELYMLKAKILKHSNELFKAVQSLKEAQEMDASDRFVGSKCAKYMLRAGQIEEAVVMMAVALKKKGKIGESLKKCFEIKRYFEEVCED